MIQRFIYETIDSTNLEAFRLAKMQLGKTDIESEKGAIKAPFLVWAKSQTDGRGRVGRQWQSEEGGLFFSMYLCPKMDAEKVSMLTIVMAMAVYRAVSRYIAECAGQRKSAKRDLSIKWPNDIVLNGKKIVGILTTLQMDVDGYGVVIGVGVNTNQTSFLEELSDRATSIQREIGVSILDEILLKYIEEYFMQAYTTFEREQTLLFLKEEYEKQLANKDRQVRVLDPAGEYQAIAKGINEKGHLLVELEDGSLQEVYAGEVSVRGIYGYVD